MDCRRTDMDATEILRQEYCAEFDERRKNAIVCSFYKYGPSKENFQKGMVDAIGSLKKNLKKFEETGNTEYLVDIANYAMFRYMYPMEGESYKATDSNQSAGVDGITINEMKKFQEEHKYE
jgi:hypothetical protein